MKIKLTLKQIRKTILVVTLLVCAGGVGFWLGSYKAFLPSQSGKSLVINKETPAGKQNIGFSLFWEVWDRLGASFIDKTKLDSRQMVYGSIKGLVSSLGDPYTVFLPPDENKLAKQDLDGSFEGVGIQLGYKDNNLAVIAPLSGSPAEKAGVKAGDLILKIADRESNGISLPEAVQLIRGPQGTTIKLSLLHEGEKSPYEASIVRETINVPSVEVQFIESQNNKKIALLRLTKFGTSTDSEWEKAVGEIVATCGNGKPTNCAGAILDLRNNPGGYLSGSVFIASEFLNSGIVVYQQKATGEQQSYSVDRKGKLIDYPLTVLVNKGSASASEIVAGALAERKQVKLVGDITFGKGTIQEAEDLSEGSGLHVTVARWLLPSKASIDEKGLTPDFQIQDNPDTEKDEQLEKAKEVLLK